jgi:hypothetical protein
MQIIGVAASLRERVRGTDFLVGLSRTGVVVAVVLSRCRSVAVWTRPTRRTLRALRPACDVSRAAPDCLHVGISFAMLARGPIGNARSQPASDGPGPRGWVAPAVPARRMLDPAWLPLSCLETLNHHPPRPDPTEPNRALSSTARPCCSSEPPWDTFVGHALLLDQYRHRGCGRTRPGALPSWRSATSPKHT